MNTLDPNIAILGVKLVRDPTSYVLEHLKVTKQAQIQLNKYLVSSYLDKWASVTGHSARKQGGVGKAGSQPAALGLPASLPPLALPHPLRGLAHPSSIHTTPHIAACGRPWHFLALEDRCCNEAHHGLEAGSGTIEWGIWGSQSPEHSL